MDDEILLGNFQAKLDKLCEDVAGIKVRMDDMAKNAKNIAEMDGRVRRLENAQYKIAVLATALTLIIAHGSDFVVALLAMIK